MGFCRRVFGLSAPCFTGTIPPSFTIKGGWLNEESPKWFSDFTLKVAERLGDRIVDWMTLNEPQVFVGLGHGTGEHAPGDKLPIAKQLKIVRNVQLAHGFGCPSPARGMCQEGSGLAGLQWG